MFRLVFYLLRLVVCLLQVLLLAFLDVIQRLFILLKLCLESSCKLFHARCHLKHIFFYLLPVFRFIPLLSIKIDSLCFLLLFLSLLEIGQLLILI